MATGALDANGIWQYGEDDSETTFSALLNKLGGSVSGSMKGRIAQVVSATYNTATVSSSSTYADTGLTATITPKYSTSKILVIVSQNGLYKDTGNIGNSVQLRLLRSGTILNYFGYAVGYTGTSSTSYPGSGVINIIDTPGVTTATIYKTQFANLNTAAVVGVQTGAATSTITLIEITA